MREYLSALAVFALLSLLAVLALSTAGISWSSWQPATCMPDACFCEAIRSGSVRQPANTWSNLGFVLIGLLVIAQARLDHRNADAPRNPMTGSPAYASVLGGACVIMGLGSVFYHASLSFAGQFFDVMGMYLFAVFVLLYNLTRLHDIGARRFVVAYVVANVVLGYLLIAQPQLRRWLFALLLVAALVPEYLLRRQGRALADDRFLAASLVLLLLAFAIWILDLSRVLCSPSSLVQGHAAWHLLDALAAGAIYSYFRSEQMPPALAS